ncbi:hypothetical protein BS78_01G202000 [Paspalum vaginatum]|nr:hypothetical protein BS78_01G202000 [Paspalum vaginatum]
MGSGDPAADPLASFLRHPGALSFSRRVAMARDATATAVPALRPWLVDLLPLLVVLLIAAHVLALVRLLDLQARHGRVQAARAEQEALGGHGRRRMLAASVWYFSLASFAC